MGFLKPGISRKELIIPKRVVVPTKKRKSKDLDSKKKSSKKSKKASKKKTKIPRVPLTFSALPAEIIHRIFLYSEPHNNLPLVSKHFNDLLKFDPHNTISSNEPWNNVSLVVDMIKEWYLLDLNSRLDFGLLQRKLDYYKNRIISVSQEFEHTRTNPEVTLDSYRCYRLILRNIGVIEETMKSFGMTKNSIAISDKVLSHRFVSAGLIETVFKAHIFGEDSHDFDSLLNLLSDRDTDFECKTRLRFFKFKFQELSYYFNYLGRQLSGEEIPETELHILDIQPGESPEDQNLNPLIKEIQSREEQVLEGNEKLPDVYDDDYEIKQWKENDQSKYVCGFPFTIKNNTMHYNIKHMWLDRTFPSQVTRNGITSNNNLKLIQSLSEIYYYKFAGVEDIIIGTLHKFERPETTTSELLLDEVFDYIIKNSKDTTITEVVVLTLLKLYTKFESQDSSGYPKNPRGDTVFENISQALIKIVETFYNQTTFEDRLVWKFILESKNLDIAQLFMKFTSGPSFDLLH